MEVSLLDYFTIKVPGISRPQKLFMMAWLSMNFYLQYIGMCTSDPLIFNIE